LAQAQGGWQPWRPKVHRRLREGLPCRRLRMGQDVHHRKKKKSMDITTTITMDTIINQKMDIITITAIITRKPMEMET